MILFANTNGDIRVICLLTRHVVLALYYARAVVECVLLASRSRVRAIHNQSAKTHLFLSFHFQTDIRHFCVKKKKRSFLLSQAFVDHGNNDRNNVAGLVELRFVLPLCTLLLWREFRDLPFRNTPYWAARHRRLRRNPCRNCHTALPSHIQHRRPRNCIRLPIRISCWKQTSVVHSEKG